MNTIKEIHIKKITVNLQNLIYILPGNAINYCPNKYHKFLSGKIARIFKIKIIIM